MVKKRTEQCEVKFTSLQFTLKSTLSLWRPYSRIPLDEVRHSCWGIHLPLAEFAACWRKSYSQFSTVRPLMSCWFRRSEFGHVVRKSTLIRSACAEDVKLFELKALLVSSDFSPPLTERMGMRGGLWWVQVWGGWFSLTRVGYAGRFSVEMSTLKAAVLYVHISIICCAR